MAATLLSIIIIGSGCGFNEGLVFSDSVVTVVSVEVVAVLLVAAAEVACDGGFGGVRLVVSPLVAFANSNEDFVSSPESSLSKRALFNLLFGVLLPLHATALVSLELFCSCFPDKDVVSAVAGGGGDADDRGTL